MECLGCRLSNHEEEVNIIYEDDSVTCILDINPFNEGHSLIIPKRHFLDLEELDQQTLCSINQASVIITKVLKEIFKPEGITIIQNGGYFNDLRHYHMHVFPRYKNDGFGWVEPVNDAGNKLKETCETMNKIIKSIV